VYRALAFTLLAVALVVVAFVATWLTIPGGHYELRNLTQGGWETGRITYPARLFRPGLSQRLLCESIGIGRAGEFNGEQAGCVAGDIYRAVDLSTVKHRVFIAYGGLVAVIVLIGAAFGALRRRPRPQVPPSFPA
jgi:hypothetical protein